MKNINNKISFDETDKYLAKKNPKLKEMLFSKGEDFDKSFLNEFEKKEKVVLPTLFVNFMEQCGGAELDMETYRIFPFHEESQEENLCVSFEINEYEGRTTVSFWIDGFITNEYKREMDTLAFAFSDQTPDGLKCLGDRRVEKILPFANSNGDLLCLDFNTSTSNPSVVLVEYDGLGLFNVFENFEEFLIKLGNTN